jgi:SAM-dependent methyltransferase
MTKTNNQQQDDREAWSTFWARNTGADGGGCLPERWAAIEEAQKSVWHDFLTDLPQGAQVLDLATGDGRVLRWMREARGDLTLVGIDLAPELPPAPTGTQTQGGIAMESLPFDDGTCAAVVSQFGFEYGDIAKVAREIARVLVSGGKVGLMVHRGDGPILEHNLARRGAIEWAVREQDVGTVVRNALTAPNGGAQVAAQVAAAFTMLGANKYGQETPAWEIPEAMRRTIVLGQFSGAQSVMESITAIEDQARNELGRIASLERACRAADDRRKIEAAFGKHGLSLRSLVPINEPQGRVLADMLVFG